MIRIDLAAECYALEPDPADATDDFRIVSIEVEDGEPKVEWELKVNRWTGAEIQAVLKGAAIPSQCQQRGLTGWREKSYNIPATAQERKTL